MTGTSWCALSIAFGGLFYKVITANWGNETIGLRMAGWVILSVALFAASVFAGFMTLVHWFV